MPKKSRLVLRPVAAKLKKSTDVFTKMDPYLVITLGSQKEKTRTCKRGGKKPSWTDSFAFNLTGYEAMIDITCFDHDTFTSDDYIAECHVNLEELFHEKVGQRWFPMTRKGGKDGGELLLDWEYITVGKNKGMGGNQYNQGLQQQQMRMQQMGMQQRQQQMNMQQQQQQMNMQRQQQQMNMQRQQQNINNQQQQINMQRQQSMNNGGMGMNNGGMGMGMNNGGMGMNRGGMGMNNGGMGMGMAPPNPHNNQFVNQFAQQGMGGLTPPPPPAYMRGGNQGGQGGYGGQGGFGNGY